MTPMLRQLRQSFKGEIRLVCSQQHYDLWRNCPEIDHLQAVKKSHIVGFYTHQLGKTEPERLSQIVDFSNTTDPPTRYLYSLAERSVPFLDPCDVIFLPRGCADFYDGLNLACLAPAAHRVMMRHYEGRDAKWNNGYDQNITHLVRRTSRSPHESNNMIEMLKVFGITPKYDPARLYYWPTAHDISVVDNVYTPATGKRQIVMAPGATARYKMWPAEYFIETMTRLRQHTDYELVLIGAESDAAVSRTLASAAPVKVHDMTGRLTLPQTINLLTRCNLLIGNCSSPVHMASAAQIPRIHISCHAKSGHPDHGNSPLRFGTVGNKAIILQPEVMMGPPCIESCYAGESHCIRGVTPDLVVVSALRLLKAEIHCNTESC